MEQPVVFRSSLRARFYAAVLFALPLLLIAAGVHEGRADGPGMVRTGVMCLFVFGYFGVLIGFARWRVDDEGLQRLTPLTKRIRISWRDVTSVQEAWRGGLVLRGRFATAVQVHGGLARMDELRLIALARAPVTAFTDFTRRSLERQLGAVDAPTAVPVDAPEPVVQVRGDAIVRWRDNPFFVLGLSPECSRAEVEREGQKLLALLAIESGPAKRFATPVGERERTPETVRAAMAELRDPERRLLHETWARIGADARIPAPPAAIDDPARPWPEAMAAIGWRGGVIPIGSIIGGLAASRGLGGITARQSSPRAGNMALRAVAWFFGLTVATALLKAFPWPGRLALAAVFAASLPALFLRAALIPLRLPRVAYWFAILSPPLAHSAEIRGGAALVGMLALARRKTLDPATVDWFDRKLAMAHRTRSLSMAAAGLIAAARGKKETTRLLFHAIDGVSSSSPRVARRVARSWLMADAAERGEWKEVAALGRKGRSYLRWPYAMAAIARRITFDERSPSSLALWLAWVVAPNRIATFPLLRRALAVPRTKDVAHAAPPPIPPDGGEALEAALRAHATCLRKPTDASLLAAGFAWDAVRASAAVRSLLARRALSLETRTTAEAALATLLETAQADLAPHLRGLPASLLAKSATLDAATGHARRRAMDEIESRAHAMAQRTARKTALHTTGEWMEWGAMRRLCERASRDAASDVRRSVFATVYAPACNYGVWLFNVRGEKVLANGIFRWLAEEARAVSDPVALKVLEKNVKAGIGV